MVRTKRRKLGRGLEALLPHDIIEENFKYASPFNIKDNPYQVREVENIDDLLPSIKEHGIIQPLLVRQVNGEFVLIAGARRLKAAKELNLEKVPVYILQVNDRKALALTLIENLEREDLNPIEVAEGYRRLIDEFELTHEEVARIFGKDRSTITNSLRLLKLDEATRELVKKGLLTEGHARLLVGLDEKEQKTVVAEILKMKLSVRETEIFIRKMKNKRVVRKQRTSKFVSNLLGVDVLVQNKKKGGKIVINFKDKNEFERIAELLKLGG